MAVTKEILTLAVETGDALLRNGAEVYRVEDTVLHILKAYEITDCDVYVLSNGIFASANENKERCLQHDPSCTARLYPSRKDCCVKSAFQRDLFP